jgi:hypothetical protein
MFYVDAIPTSAAGTMLAQASGSDVARIQVEAIARRRRIDSLTQADEAAGISRPNANLESNDRGPSARLPWYVNLGLRQSSIPLDDRIQNGHQIDLLG